MATWILAPKADSVNRKCVNGCRMFCFPPAGYGAWIYQEWEKELGDVVEICPIEYPGKSSRMSEKPIDDMATLVKEICHNLKSEFDRQPCVFFGHSMGAWIAYEVIRRLCAEGIRTPLKLYASGNRSPILYGKDFDKDPLCLGDLAFCEFWSAFEKYASNPLLECPAISRIHLRRYGLNASLQNERIREFVYPCFRADYRMIESYCLTGDRGHLLQPHVLKSDSGFGIGDVELQCPICALSGEDDQRVTHIGLDAWRFVTSSIFSTYQFPGVDHDCIHQNNGQLLEFLRQDLIISLKGTRQIL